MRAQIYGSFLVFSKDEGTNVTPRGRKTRALLTCLICSGGAQLAKSWIVGLLWGDRGDVQARCSLRQALRELRTCINRSREIVCSDRDHVWVDPAEVAEIPLNEAADFHEPFEDLGGISAEFDDWLLLERSRRSKRQIANLKERAETLVLNGCADEALSVIELIQAMDPHNEDALPLALTAEFQRGHPAGIAQRYDAAAQILKADLGVQPSDETRHLRNLLIDRLTAPQRGQPQLEGDEEYFARRASDERSAAEKAVTDAARDIHGALAQTYDALAGGRWPSPSATPIILIPGDRQIARAQTANALPASTGRSRRL